MIRTHSGRVHGVDLGGRWQTRSRNWLCWAGQSVSRVEVGAREPARLGPRAGQGRAGAEPMSRVVVGVSGSPPEGEGMFARFPDRTWAALWEAEAAATLDRAFEEAFGGDRRACPSYAGTCGGASPAGPCASWPDDPTTRRPARRRSPARPPLRGRGGWPAAPTCGVPGADRARARSAGRLAEAAAPGRARGLRGRGHRGRGCRERGAPGGRVQARARRRPPIVTMVAATSPSRARQAAGLPSGPLSSRAP